MQVITTTDRWWKYRGYVIWFFDGYYDVQVHMDADPIGSFATADEARAFINNERATRQLMKVMGMEDEK